MEYVEKAKQIVGEIFKNTDVTDPFLLKSDPLHSKAAHEWVLKLDPNASEVLQIAALFHDIDRAFKDRSIKQEDYPKDQYERYKRDHSINSAKIAAEYLEDADFPKDLVSIVSELIINHEIGGNNPELQTLMEADSLTFFSVSIYFYLEDRGKEKTKKKIVFMYNRLPEKAKGLVNSLKFKTPEVENLFKEAKKEFQKV